MRDDHERLCRLKHDLRRNARSPRRRSFQYATSLRNIRFCDLGVLRRLAILAQPGRTHGCYTRSLHERVQTHTGRGQHSPAPLISEHPRCTYVRGAGRNRTDE